MPPIHVPAKVLVTGASGFIGSWVVRTLLERGYRVRATVRTQEKGQYLERLFEVYDEEFEYVIVENCTQEGAFDHVLDGIDAVEHHAYPLAGNPDDFISVAVRGTIVLLTSVLNHGHSVGRVVITSSAAAVMEPREAGHRYTEAEWNCFSVREIQAKGMKADALHKYRASKTLAEKAAWEFVSKHQDSIAWDLIAILPTIVYGPVIHQVESFEQLNYSNQLLYDSVLHERGPTDPGVNWTDVRDVAEIHVRLLEKQCAGNNRFIVSAGVHSWQELYDALKSGSRPLSGVPRGKPGNRMGRPPYVFSSEKVVGLLDIHFKELGESARDAIVSIRELGL